jgi:hypothetical protein
MNYTVVDPKLQRRNLHNHVFSICRKLNVFPTKMDVDKNTIKISLLNKSILTVFPEKEELEMVIPKENIEEWSELYKNFENKDQFTAKEQLHDIIAKYDSRDIRFHNARMYKDNSNIDISMYDYQGDKKNKIESIQIKPEGIYIHYKYSIDYDLYKAFNMNIYKY